MTAYAALGDLVTAMPATAFNTVLVTTQQACLDQANAYIDDKLRARYRLPLASWSPSLTRAAVDIAMFNIMCVRGFNPAAGADINIRGRYDYAMRYLDDVERQRAHPIVVEASAPGTLEYDAPLVISKPRDGWIPGTADPQPDQSGFVPSWSRPLNNGND